MKRQLPELFSMRPAGLNSDSFWFVPVDTESRIAILKEVHRDDGAKTAENRQTEKADRDVNNDKVRP